MANVKFPKKIFEKEIGKLDDKMQAQIALFGTTVEDLTETELEIDVTPNRPDLLSYHGYKRSFLAFLGKKTGLKTYKVNAPEKDYEVKVDSSVKDVRPFTVCAIISAVQRRRTQAIPIGQTPPRPYFHNTRRKIRDPFAFFISRLR